MTRKQLQSLISAGVFSAALLAGAAYADDSATAAGSNPPPQAPSQNTDPNVQPPPSANNGSAQANTAPSNSPDAKQTSKSDKDAGQHGCSGAGGCSGH